MWVPKDPTQITWITLLIVELIHANRGPIGREEGDWRQRGAGGRFEGRLGGGGGLTPSVSPGAFRGEPSTPNPLNASSVPVLFNPRGPHLPEDDQKNVKASA